jgi:hypothetical protein
MAHAIALMQTAADREDRTEKHVAMENRLSPIANCSASSCWKQENPGKPLIDALMKLEADKKILAGGLPVGDRALVFILEAASHEEADQLLRDLPAWGVLQWAVTPLQSFEGRAKKERSVVEGFKKQIQ